MARVRPNPSAARWLRQRPPRLVAIDEIRLSRRNAVKKGDERGRTSGEDPKRRAVAPLDRQGAGQAMGRQMLHQADEKGQSAAFTRFS